MAIQEIMEAEVMDVGVFEGFQPGCTYIHGRGSGISEPVLSLFAGE